MTQIKPSRQNTEVKTIYSSCHSKDDSGNHDSDVDGDDDNDDGNGSKPYRTRFTIPKLIKAIHQLFPCPAISQVQVLV